MRSSVRTVVVSNVIVFTLVLAVPSRSLAQAEAAQLSLRAVPAVAAGIPNPFAREALRHTVETTPSGPAPTVQQVPPVAAGRDSVWNGVLIGTGIGAVWGGVAGAKGECSTGVSSDCDMLTGQAVAAGILIGGLMGAGLGALVDWLIR